MRKLERALLFIAVFALGATVGAIIQESIAPKRFEACAATYPMTCNEQRVWEIPKPVDVTIEGVI